MQSKPQDGEQAVANLKAWNGEYHQRLQRHDRSVQLCQKYREASGRADAAFRSNPTEETLAALVEAQPRAEAVRRILAELSMGRRNVLEIFLSEIAGRLKADLLTAAEHKRSLAQEIFEREFAHAKSALAEEGFDDETVLKAPKVAGAKRKVEHFELIIRTVQATSDPQLLWGYVPQFSDQ